MDTLTEPSNGDVTLVISDGFASSSYLSYWPSLALLSAYILHLTNELACGGVLSEIMEVGGLTPVLQV
jgi:hypothetical protein